MIRLSIISLWARRRRLLGTTVAVFLGVAFLSGTLVLGDTLSANFDRLFAEVSAGTDVVVRNGESIDSADSPEDARGLLDQSLVEQVAGIDGVEVAEGQVVGYGALVGSDGDPVGGNGPPRLAGSWIEDPDLNPYELVEGRAPEGSDEVVVNRGAADLGKVDIGDTVTVQTPQPIEVTIVGIATFGGEDGLGTTTWTAFSLEGAQEHVTRDSGSVSTILVQAAGGIDSEDLRAQIEAALPGNVEAITGTELASERSDAISAEFLDMVRMFLVVFAGIALVVATLSIANTFSITVAQRTRELALMRAVGASRQQLRRTVTVEALGIGIVASTLGVVGGIGVAQLLKVVFDAFGFALPAGGLTLEPLPLLGAFAVGVVVTFLAARSAARRAASLSPVEAMRESAAESRHIGAQRRLVGMALAATGGVAAVAGAMTDGLLVAGVGSLLLVVATLLLTPVALSPVARVVGAGLRRLRGVNGMLAEENARRNPRRSAATATALVVGVAVVALFTVFAASMKTALADQVADDFGSDLAVSAPSFGGGRLSPEMAGELADLDEVAGVVGLGGGPVLLDGDSTTMTAVSDPEGLATIGGIDTVDGSFTDLGDDGIAVSDTRAEDEGWSVGSTVELGFVDGSTATATIEAVYGENSMVGGLVMPASTWAAHNVQPTDTSVLVDVADDASIAEARAAIEPIADRHGADVEDADEFASTASQGLDLLLGIVYVLLALAVIIALMGISNTLSLAVHERRRELGLLRAVGQTRRQVRSVLRLESVIVALFGTLVGLALGAFLGWALFATVWTDGGGFTLPFTNLLVIAVMGALAGVLAARRPAKRAARTPVLEAIAAS